MYNKFYLECLPRVINQLSYFVRKLRETIINSVYAENVG